MRSPTTRRPPASMRAMAPPMAALRTASGLMIPNVLSMAMLLLRLLDEGGDGLAQVRGGRCDGDPGVLQGRDLVLRAPLATRDDGAGVAHASPGWGRDARDEGGHRLLHLLLDEAGGVFLGRPADLTDEQHGLGL